MVLESILADDLLEIGVPFLHRIQEAGVMLFGGCDNLLGDVEMSVIKVQMIIEFLVHQSSIILHINLILRNLSNLSDFDNPIIIHEFTLHPSLRYLNSQMVEWRRNGRGMEMRRGNNSVVVICSC
jgi:hypothetical protein